ncbi:MAG: SprT family zinc-dependent metalloprotease [Acidobacteria bacterium]|nr:SprT family zinc-dependent metalloprotease [Acidobacteriota bacterium]
MAFGFQIRLPWDVPSAPVRSTTPSSIEIDGHTWPLKIVRHQRARRYVLRMTDAGGLRLTVPRRASVAAGVAFVRSQGPWIARERVRRHTRVEGWQPGAPVWFRGEQTPVLCDDTHVQLGECRWLKSSDARTLREEVEMFLRALAARELPERCLALAATCGESVARVSIRNQRSRWGSCSTRRTIALNWRLVLMPPSVADYVILHELMHLRQPNHSRAFWREVASVCPEWREAERWLTLHGRDLL